jgi:hypothetical protein
MVRGAGANSKADKHGYDEIKFHVLIKETGNSEKDRSTKLKTLIILMIGIL